MEAGSNAFEWTRRFVELGPRPSGSDALKKQQKLIGDALGELSCAVETDEFVAVTPKGAVPMRNIIARFGSSDSESVFVVSGHYETLAQEGFVGANDGGSSAGFLMAIAERLNHSDTPVWVVFLDGEEAIERWSLSDHTYGSRHLAGRWAAAGTASRIKALINVDMIGDADLGLLYEGYSDRELRDQVWSIADRLGYSSHFPRQLGYIEDDHREFLAVGIPSVDLIDFEYGPGNSYWHSVGDTLDKLSPSSFAVVLHVIEEAIRELARGK